MAAPVINSATFTPANPTPGSTVVITVLASDPDGRTVTVTIPVKDSAGNAANATLTIPISDPLTFGPATVSDPSGVAKVTQDAASPNVFRVTV